MAPFPEDEIMTIKRLEVALKRQDYNLLRDGAYKLHEKYHAHHHFEYTDLLRVILEEVEENQAIPSEIKDILVPTINDILSDDLNEEPQNRVSGLTSLSYDIGPKPQQITQEKPAWQTESKSEPVENEEKSYIKPFQEFTPLQSIEMIQNAVKEQNITFKPEFNTDDTKSLVENFNEQPAEDLITDTPVIQQQNIFETGEENPPEFLSTQEDETEAIEASEDELQEFAKEQEIEAEPVSDEVETDEAEEIQEELNVEIDEETAEPEEDLQEQQPQENTPEAEEFVEEEPEEEPVIVENPEPVKKSIAIFYGQNSSNEKISNILKYRELLYNQKDFSLREITSLINEIRTQADTNVSELQLFLDKLKYTPHIINLLTNSQSANLIELLEQGDISYSIFNPSEDKRVNLLPLLGLTNIYKCPECFVEHLDTNEKINPFILQCPKCKGAMLPDLYTIKGEINMDYYNSSMITLANSDVWLLIHPSLSEKLTLNMIKSAFKMSSSVREVYILDKDINVQETYKRIFEENKNIKVITGINAVEEFFSNI